MAQTQRQVRSPWLTGPYAPVTEEVTLTDLEVTGQLPEELHGRYLRNGPNPVTPPDPATYHWFTGEGMVHGIRLSEGRARWYRNRWIRSGPVSEALGEAPRPGPVHGFDFAPNTNVIGHAGRTFAIVEAGALPYELTDELGTVGPTDFDGTLEGFTAHPKRDPATGELHAVSYYFGWGNQVRYTVQDRTGRVVRQVDVPTTGPVSVHDMALTARYAVVLDLPVIFDLEMAAGGSAFPYRWEPGYPARVGLLPREGGADDVTWLDVERCYVFHTLNAYDDGEAVVLDVVRYPKIFDQERLGPSEAVATLERWTLDPASGTVKEERLDDRGQEFPRVDERVVGGRHRFGYAVGTSGRLGIEDFGGVLLRHDLERGTSEVRPVGEGRVAGEAVFVPRTAEAGESDGWVLSLVQDAGRGATDLLVLNAGDFTGEPAAVVHLPVRVPVGFHGNWVPD